MCYVWTILLHRNWHQIKVAASQKSFHLSRFLKRMCQITILNFFTLGWKYKNKAKLFQEAKFFVILFTYLLVIIQVQNGNGVHTQQASFMSKMQVTSLVLTYSSYRRWWRQRNLLLKTIWLCYNSKEIFYRFCFSTKKAKIVQKYTEQTKILSLSQTWWKRFYQSDDNKKHPYCRPKNKWQKYAGMDF